ncbi:hypothetical protein [uncultured Algoriphagus sp.]|uniref:hypothetical protein n=1 Tax=uncultured Algoriphagus sp. TaxID=417365 RepID=UPI00258D56FD|nr:hypothetical protein [uncultured Algoriphagus sp.]
MKKIKIFLGLTITLVFTFQSPLFSVGCGLPVMEGCEFIAGGGPCQGDASTYLCNGNIVVYSTLLPNGACAGAHLDCQSVPSFG